MKSDRQTYRSQYSPSGGLARMIDHGLPLARGDTGSEGIQKLGGSYTPDRRWEMDSCIPSRTRYCHSRMLLSGILERSQNKIPAFAGMTGIQRQKWITPLGKYPTGFSELDVGEPPDVERDVGLMLDDLVSSELETTRLTDDEVHNGYCLTMDRTRFRLCQN